MKSFLVFLPLRDKLLRQTSLILLVNICPWKFYLFRSANMFHSCPDKCSDGSPAKL